MTSKPTTQPRAHRRSRRQRLAAGAVLASTTLLGTYLAAVRPQPTYASPTKGGAGQGQDRDPSGRSLGASFVARSVPTCGVQDPLATDEQTLASAILSAVDGGTICVSGTILLQSALPHITTTLTLVGDGGGDDTIAPDLSYESVVGSILTADLHVDDTLTVANLGFQGGRAQNTAGQGMRARGGAIYVTDGSLVVHDSTFTDNRTDPSVTGLGGAVSVEGNAYIYGSTFSNNAVGVGSGNSGGALFVRDKTVIGAGNSFTGNAAHSRGGAVYTPNGPISITASVFTGNTAANGAAVSVRNFTGVMPIVDSIFEGNRAASSYGYGGAVLTYGDVAISGASLFEDNYGTDGGAVYARSATITGATFTGNEATETGGAVLVFEGASISDSTFSGNKATTNGGAIYAMRTASSKTLSIDSSTFTSNEATDGGAVHWDGSDDTIAIADSSFSANRALRGGDGGALKLLKSSGAIAVAQVESSTFTSNSADNRGGAIRLQLAVDASVSYSSLTGNSAAVSGGAISHSSGRTSLVNTYVGGNSAADAGGISGTSSSGHVTLHFSTVFDNSASSSAAGVAEGVKTSGRLTAVGSLVGNPQDDTVVSAGSIDDTYSISTGVSRVFNGTGSQLVAPSALALGAPDGTGPGREGRSPGASSPLVTGAPDSGLNTGVTLDQLSVLRVGTWTIGARQVAGGAIPTPTPTPVYPPAPPTNVSAVPGDRSAVVSWVAPASAGSFPVSTYKATASPGGQSCLVVAPALTCTVTGLANGTPYTFTVQALNGAGWSPASDPSNVVRPGGETPAPGPQPLPGPLAPGESLLQVNGVTDPNVQVDPNQQDNGLSISGDGWSMSLDGLGPDGNPLNLGPDGELRLQGERDVVTEGTGFLPNSQVDLYVDPPVLVTGASARAGARSTEAIYVGTVKTDASGRFAGTATLPADIAPGDHVLQAAGYSPSRAVRAMSLGVVIEPSLVLDKGRRSADGRHDRIRTTGSSTGIDAGVKLTPWIRYSGQASFTQGKATITVQSDGTFRWTRQIRKNRGITAYVSYVDTKSNEVFWAKVR